MFLKIRSGVIEVAEISTSLDSEVASKEAASSELVLKGCKIYEIEDFWTLLQKAEGVREMERLLPVASWLSAMFAKAGPEPLLIQHQ